MVQYSKPRSPEVLVTSTERSLAKLEALQRETGLTGDELWAEYTRRKALDKGEPSPQGDPVQADRNSPAFNQSGRSSF